jgi:signal transduction histidine kinase
VVKAVQTAAERTLDGSSLRLAVDVRGRARAMSPRICDATALIVEQAITNVLRHAQAETVHLMLDFGVRRLCISIRDDGRGFVRDDGAKAATHFGLVGMRERAREIGAEVRVRSALEHGTTVSVLVPYRSR